MSEDEKYYTDRIVALREAGEEMARAVKTLLRELPTEGDDEGLLTQSDRLASALARWRKVVGPAQGAKP